MQDKLTDGNIDDITKAHYLRIGLKKLIKERHEIMGPTFIIS